LEKVDEFARYQVEEVLDVRSGHGDIGEAYTIVVRQLTRIPPSWNDAE
jgi:hypothetical protein